MKKYILPLALTAVMVSGANAKPITPDEALSRLGGSSLRVAAKGKAALKLAHTATTANGSPAVYVFNRGQKAGYVILSADDLAYPVLGYADEGSFSDGDIPPQMEWWLGEYARQIEYANQRNESPLNSAVQKITRANREAIAPQIKTKWDQGNPYNLKTPKYGTDPSFTGCVATAMAQVMNYWQYPEVGKGSIQYVCESLQKRLSMNFGLEKFDWANMADTYLPGLYTQEEANAVAYLMKAAGYSVKMDYSADSSGALAMNIGNALVKYFNYDGNLTYTLRMYYSASQWDQMIYDNIKNVGPVIYGGGSFLGGGHSFICDGYDGEGFYHFNWGWSGMSDGYFSLDAISPDALGAGGGAGGGYNFTQDAVLGVQPPTGQPVVAQPKVLTQMGSLEGTISADSLLFDLVGEDGAMFVNYQPSSMKVQLGAILEPQGTTPGEKISLPILDVKFDLEAGYGISPSGGKAHLNLPSLNIADGTYKVSAAYAFWEQEPLEWLPMKCCYAASQYFILRKQGNTYTVENEPVNELYLDGAEVVGDLYYGCVSRYRINVVNETDYELSRGFAPCFMLQGIPLFLGESVFVTVPPHSSVIKEWTTDLYALQQIGGVGGDIVLDLGFFDESTYLIMTSLEGNYITMHPNPGSPTLVNIGNPIISGDGVVAGVVQEEIREGDSRMVTLVNDPSNIPITANVRLSKGYFAYNLYAVIVRPDLTETSGYAEILSMSGKPVFIESPGLRTSFQTTLSYPIAEPGVYYYITLAYTYGSNFMPAGSGATWFRLAREASAVDELPEAAEEAGDGKIYNLQGMELGSDFESLPAGLYIRNGKKVIKK